MDGSAIYRHRCTAGETSCKDQSWGNEFELYGVCSALGHFMEKWPAGTGQFSILDLRNSLENNITGFGVETLEVDKLV